jgi:hypothetical protein
MKKDEVWKQINEDKTEVYGMSMLDAFLKTVEVLEPHHYGDLPDAKREIVQDPSLKLGFAKTVKEAEKALGGEPWATEKKERAFAAAAFNGNLPVVKWMDKNFDFGTVHWHPGGARRSALTSAAENGHLEIVKYFVEEKKETQVSSAFCAAAGKGDFAIVKYLADTMKNDLYGKSEVLSHMNFALEKAAEGGHLEMVKHLVEEGATNFYKSMEGAGLNGKWHVVRFFVDQGASSGLALHFAAKGGNLELARYLIEERGCKHVEDALQTAAINDKVEIVKYLVERELVTKEDMQKTMSYARPSVKEYLSKVVS